MAFPETLQNFIKDAIWPIYVCTNPTCKNSAGDPSYEEAMGLDKTNAPLTIKCSVCGSDMKKEN